MNSKHDYPIAAGEYDRQRLIILNKVYNPTTYSFLQQSGLKAGMKVLEIGCRIGTMACWLAQQVTNTGKVIAIDSNEEYLNIARQTAKEKGLTNVEFKLFDIRNISELKEKFDFIYGRAVIEYVEDRKNAFKALYELLKPEGILTYESVSAIENAHFSYPQQPVIDEYFSINKTYFLTSKMASDSPSDLYPWFKQLGYKDIAIKANQPVLYNREDKSLVRLGVLTVRNTLYKKYSDVEFEKIILQLQKIEDDDEIIMGYIRSLLIKGVKSHVLK